jgi:hypothetical protein
MRKPYARDYPGSTVEEQRAVLEAELGSLEYLYADEKPRRKRAPEDDPMPQRTKAIARMREGDELVVSTPAVIGFTEQDTRSVLAGLAERGATLYVVSLRRQFRWHPDAADALDLARLTAQVVQDAKAAAMRAGKAKFGSGGRGKRALTEEQKAEIKRLYWHDPTVSVAWIGEKYGCSDSTLNKRLGPRGTPVFGTAKAALRLDRRFK